MTAPAHSAPSLGATEWFLLLALSILWGGSFFFTGVAVRELPPLSIVLSRVSLAALTLLLMVRLSGLRMPESRRDWLSFAGMGLLNNLIPFCLIVWGQTRLPSGTAAILNATTPLFTVLVAHTLTVDERLTGSRLAGTLCGFAGVAVMIGPAALGGLGGDVLAHAAVLLAALSYACAGVYGRRFRGRPPLVTAAGQLTTAAVLLLPVALAIDRPWTLGTPGAATLAALLGSALASTALAYVLFFRILASAGASNVALVTFLIPVSALLLGTQILGESLEPRQLAGMAMIAGGLALIDGRPLRRAALLFAR